MQIITMSSKEVDHHNVISRLIRNELNGSQVAKLLKLSTRHVRRLKSRVLKDGAVGLVHVLRGQPGNRRLPDKERNKIIVLLHKHYSDFHPTFACEKLAECHKIVRDPKTIRAIQIDEGLWKPKQKKSGSTHRSWRARRPCYGEMEQFDGSYEYWFEDRGPKCCLLVAIDDATGNITKAVFVKDEGVFPVFAFWKTYLEEHGKPRTIYLDKFSTYQMNSAVAKDNPDLLTQFQRAAEELHIEIIPANSPQAKGRVERVFETLQDRFIKELRLAKISTMEEGNDFLKTYLPEFNARFGVVAANTANLHTALTPKERALLPSIFSHQKTRVMQNDFTVAYDTHWFQLLKTQPVTVCKRDQVIVERRLDGSVQIRLRGKFLNYEVLPARPKKTKTKVWVLAKTTPRKPAIDHPWRTQMRAQTLAIKSS